MSVTRALFRGKAVLPSFAERICIQAHGASALMVVIFEFLLLFLQWCVP